MMDVHGASSCELAVEQQLPEGFFCSRWLYVHCANNLDDLARALASKLGYSDDEDVVHMRDRLERDKFVPNVGVAFPLEQTGVVGRLYTSLPLPITTGLPFHVNAAFALTPDRQSLANPDEPGDANSSHRCVLLNTSFPRSSLTCCLACEWNGTASCSLVHYPRPGVRFYGSALKEAYL